MTKPSRTSSGMLLALGAAVLFAVNGNVSKVALLNGVSSLELVSVRSAGTAVILFGLTALRNPAALRVGRRELGFLALYGVTGIAMVQRLYFVAIQRLPVGIGLLLPYGRARAAGPRPDLVDGLQLWLLGHPLGDRLAMVGLSVLPARP